MGEIRVKLTEKQFTSLAEASKKLLEAQSTYQKAADFNQAVSDLVLDAHGLKGDTPGLRIDEATKELVYSDGKEEPKEGKTPRKSKTPKPE